MNSLQLYTLAQRCPHLKEVFIGVFPSDCIPNFRLLKTRRLSKLYEDQGFSISPYQYKHGFALFGFDMTSDNSGCGTFDLATEGKISLDIKLRTASADSITIVAYLEYHAIYDNYMQGNVYGNE